MKVLVTGADGMLGTHIVKELLHQKYHVRVYLLPGVSAPTLEGLPIEICTGNILDKAALEKAIEGCDASIHAAALTDVWPSRSEKVRKVNIEGTKNIIEAALKEQQKRFIYIGSGSSFAFGSPQQPGDEQGDFVGSKYGLDYIDSKYEAQKLVLKAAAEQGLPAIVIAPTFMFGAYDSKPGAGKMILGVYERKLMFCSAGGRNFVYTGDVAVAVVNALKKGQTGECYIAGNENLTYIEAFDKIGREVDNPTKTIVLPSSLIKLYGRIGSFFGLLLKKVPLISAPMAQIACDRQCFTAQKAVKELNMPQTPIEVAIRQSFSWFKNNGHI